MEKRPSFLSMEAIFKSFISSLLKTPISGPVHIHQIYFKKTIVDHGKEIFPTFLFNTQYQKTVFYRTNLIFRSIRKKNCNVYNVYLVFEISRVGVIKKYKIKSWNIKVIINFKPNDLKTFKMLKKTWSWKELIS